MSTLPAFYFPSPAPSTEEELDRWIDAEAERAFGELRRTIRRGTFDAAQTALLLRALERAKPTVLRSGAGPARLPLLAFLAAGGQDPAHARVASMIAVAFWAGAELLDDAADGDLDPEWEKVSRHEITFASFALSTLLPPLVLAQAELPAPTLRGALGLFGRESLRTLGGQSLDLGQRGRVPAPDEVEWAAVGKNGAPAALFVGLGALLGGASGERLRAFLEYGEALGTLRQLSSDMFEVVFAPPEDARDLIQGNRPLIVAMALEGLAGRERDALRALLDRCPRDPDAIPEAQRQLRAPRTMVPFLRRMARWAERAWAALARAGATGPALERLSAQIDERAPACAGRPANDPG